MRVYEAIVKALEGIDVDAAFGGAGENAAQSPILRSRTPSVSSRLSCGEAVKQTVAAGFRQTRLIAANRRVS